MAYLQIEIPANDFSDTQKDYIVRQMVKINTALMQTNYFAPRYTLPARAKPGELYYFAAAIPASDITGEGLWLYKATGWIQLG